MRTIWRVLVRTIFWSFERGTWPYDVAVVLIVVFVLLSPRSWFNDQPVIGPRPSPMVQLRDTDPSGGVEVYRLDSKLVGPSSRTGGPELQDQLHEILRKSVRQLEQNKFQIVRIDPVLGDQGAVAYYDVSVKP